MSSQTSAFLRVVGLLMQVPGAMALISIVICLIFSEYYGIVPLLTTAAVSLGIGQLLYRRFRQNKTLAYRQTLVVVALSWLVVFVIGAIPYLMIAMHSAADSAAVSVFRNVWNALFESISGFTSTGLTVTPNAAELLHCLQWWRSFTQWVGGIGLIVLTLTILEPSSNVQQLYSAETRVERIAPTLRGTTQEIWKIYSLYTGVGILLLWLVGVPPWEAINHGLTAISTGGFSIAEGSLKSYGFPARLVIILMMTAGAASFAIHAQVLRDRKLSMFWQDTRHRALWILLGAIAILLLLEHYWFTGIWAFSDSLFQGVSALTTCGFSTVSEQTWSPFLDYS